MHQIVCWLGLAPDVTGRAYSAPPDPVAVFRGLYTSKGEGEGRRRREGRGKKERAGREWWRKFVLCPTKKKEKSAPLSLLLFLGLPHISDLVNKLRYLLIFSVLGEMD